MAIINTILVIFILLMFLVPIILIPYVLIRNLLLYLVENSVKKNPNLTTAKRFYRFFRGTPLLKYKKRWMSLIDTFKLINMNDDIPIELKKNIHEQYRKRGVNPGAIRGEETKKQKKKKSKKQN